MLCCQGGGLELDESLASGSPSCLLIHFEANTLPGRAVSRAPCLTPRQGCAPLSHVGGCRGGGQRSEAGRGGSRDCCPDGKGSFHFLRQCRGAGYLFKQPQRKPFGQTVKFLNSLLPWCLNKVLPRPCVWSQGGGWPLFLLGRPSALHPLQGQLLLAPPRKQPWRSPR